jgi:hypothetical protein
MNRIEPIIDELNETHDQEDQMLMIMEALNNTVTPIPEVGQFCISYDQHPLVAVTELYRWGFRGLNFHWRDYRQYTWEELAGQVYIVQKDELDDLLSVQYGKFILNK